MGGVWEFAQPAGSQGTRSRPGESQSKAPKALAKMSRAVSTTGCLTLGEFVTKSPSLEARVLRICFSVQAATYSASSLE